MQIDKTSRQLQKPKSKRRPSRRISVTIWLLPDVYRRVVGVKNTRKLNTPQDVFRDGFRLLEMITKYDGDGSTISILVKKGRKEIEVQFFLETTKH
jgi:hypothetical protein